MGESTFRSEDRIGLVVAVVLHAALAALLAVQAFWNPAPPPIPNRVTVSLATDVSLESTAPSPVRESRAAIAPTLAEAPAPEAEDAPDAAQPERKPPPRPEARTQPRPAPPSDTRERRRPEPQRQAPVERSSRAPGGSRIGDNFLEGQGAATNTDETRVPASQIGRSARASLQQAINRQLRPYWDAPSGLDAEQLVTVLAFRLNEDGSLAGAPRVVGQSGVTDSNRPQAPLHAERAIRAVQRAAPFDLPDEYYEAWKNISEWRFDRRL
ncbi:TonB C-terminal domain-containing protein [Erythrobacter sp.]|jgi:outer membrane biosynthesis protein TonB|uniref:TonB C-terminal domain-containing protein n=1 Tax=Erythrobacter sp. TaxID=1042 RepID=UPI002EACDD59|nr:energy transducer TonB [Erythrobacter sp.]